MGRTRQQDLVERSRRRPARVAGYDLQLTSYESDGDEDIPSVQAQDGM